MLKQLIKFILSFIPRKLPIGMTSFNVWVRDLIELSGLPDNEVSRKVAASFILRLPSTVGYIPLRKVSNELVKIASNQVAAEVLRSSNGSKETKATSATLV